MLPPKVNEGLIPASVSGGFWTGSGAALDLLREHTACAVPTVGEYTFFSHGSFLSQIKRLSDGDATAMPDVLLSAWKAKQFNSSEVPLLFSAIRRFSSFWGFHPRWLFAHRRRLSRALGKDYNNACSHFLKLCSTENLAGKSDHIDLSIAIRGIFEAIGGQYTKLDPCGKYLVFDQMIAPSHAEDAQSFIPNLKVICVDRDWKDQYVELRNEIPRMIRTKIALGQDVLGIQLSEEDIEPTTFFVKLRSRLSQIKQRHAESSNDSILWVSFEDLVNQTNLIAEQVFSFLKIDVGNWTPGEHFRPEVSRRNVGKWHHCDYEDEIRYLDKILER